MSEPFLGEIRMFAGNFAPRGWALCDGQLLAISQNTALFSLLGTTYGGDGRTTFALPEMRGRIPVHQGRGAGLAEIRIGSQGGSDAAPSTSLPTATNFSINRGVAVTQNKRDIAQERPVHPALCINFIVALAGIFPSRN